jgi:hypothetical protein
MPRPLTDQTSIGRHDYVADINYDWPWLVAPAYPDGVGRTDRN